MKLVNELIIKQTVGRLVGWSVSHNFLKKGSDTVILPYSYIILLPYHKLYKTMNWTLRFLKNNTLCFSFQSWWRALWGIETVWDNWTVGSGDACLCSYNSKTICTVCTQPSSLVHRTPCTAMYLCMYMIVHIMLGVF